MAYEDANSKLVEVVTVADVEDRVGNSLLQIWELRFGHEAIFLDIEQKVWSRIWIWSSSKILKLEFGSYFASDVL